MPGGRPTGVHVDVDDLATSAAVIGAVSSASADGWAAVESAQNALRENWIGTRSTEFAERGEQLIERARDLLTRMDAVAPDLRAAIAGYIVTDDAIAGALRLGPEQ